MFVRVFSKLPRCAPCELSLVLFSDRGTLLFVKSVLANVFRSILILQPNELHRIDLNLKKVLITACTNCLNLNNCKIATTLGSNRVPLTQGSIKRVAPNPDKVPTYHCQQGRRKAEKLRPDGCPFDKGH